MSVRRRSWRTKRGESREAWLVAYADQTGARRFETFDRRRDADARDAEIKVELRRGIHTPISTGDTVAAAFACWLDHCRAEGLERSTLEQRRTHLELHIEPFLSDVRLAALTVPRVHQFLVDLRNGGRSLAMRRKVLTNLKTAIGFAQSQGLVAQNVAAGIRIKTNTRDVTAGPLRAGVDFPSKAELKAMIDHTPDRWRPLVITAVFTGMRISELRGLPWSDVDLSKGVIHVRQRADAWRKIAAPKSKAGARDIPLAPLVVNTLKAWRLRCPKGELDLVFPNSRGRTLTVPNLRDRVLGPLQVAAGISPAYRPKYGWHSLRHAAASLFIEYLGWSPKRLQTVMGHASIQMTFDRYGHLFEDAATDTAAMGKLETALKVV